MTEPVLRPSPGFEVTVRTVLSPTDAWDAVTHWPAHGRHVPLTRVRVTRDAGGLGDEFVGRTGLGRLGFDDPMRVTQWQPPTVELPGVCGITKTGRVVHGWAVIEVREAGPEAPGGSVVRWTEQAAVGPAWLHRVQAPVTGRGGEIVFARVLRRLLEDGERAVATGG